MVALLIPHHDLRLGTPSPIPEGPEIGMVSPSYPHKGTQFGQGATQNQAGHYPLMQVPVEV